MGGSGAINRARIYASMVTTTMAVLIVASLCKGRGSHNQEKPYGYCNLACRQTFCIVFLEVAEVTQIKKPGPNENVMVVLVKHNKGNSNGVGNWEILELELVLLVVGSVSMIFNFYFFHKQAMCFCVCVI